MEINEQTRANNESGVEMKKRCLQAALFALLGWLAATPAAAWWNDDWGSRKRITVDTSATGIDLAQPLTDFPVLLRLHSGNFGYFLELAEQGNDLRFIDAEGNPLSFHVEKLDLINEMAFVWVRLPKLAANDPNQSFWMYYGNPEAASASDPAATYDTSQALVYHFGDAPGQDATAYHNNASEFNATPEPGGLIGSAARFSGEQFVRIGASPSLALNPEKGWTFSAWVKAEATQSEESIMEASDGRASLRLIVGPQGISYRYRDNNGGERVAQSQPMTPDTWHHLALVATGDYVSLFLDGREVTQEEGGISAMTPAVTLGTDAENRFFSGLLDEVEITNVARDDSWIRAQYATQGPDSVAIGYGGDETQDSGGGESFFPIILQSVSTDGWVIIGILGVMLAIALMVMISKAMVVVKVKRDNREFLEKFRALDGDHADSLDREESEEEQEFADSDLLTALFSDDYPYKHSTLYRIYHAGIQEIRRRLRRSANELTPEALAVVRVHLDATLTREVQRLSSQMVLLTIAISGGPFLGLLGTVIGVMITFAAIAATGDVNISAIAPGVSAALMTTVAGLAVAIPALFGYNYLATQIREIVADMRIFVDEFIHKVAEQSTNGKTED